jgi:hypothetical protein
LARPYIWQRKHLRRAEEAVKPIVVEVHLEAMADQPRRHSVEHLAQTEHAGGRDHHSSLAEVRGAARRQRSQGGAVGCEGLVAGPCPALRSGGLAGEG